MVTSRRELLDEMLNLVPKHLHEISGSILYSGYDAFSSPSPIYVMSINPAGDPDEITKTIAESTREMLLENRSEYSAYLDESWDGQRIGAAFVQGRMQRLLIEGLKLDPRQVPVTNLVFQRTRSAGEIPRERFAECWKFHEVMTERLGARVIVCLGKGIADHARRMAQAHEPIEENYGPDTWIYRAIDGRVVVRGVHARRTSNAAWDGNAALIQRALQAGSN